MNLDGQCPNKHFADCDICVPNGNELRRQEEAKKGREELAKEVLEHGIILRMGDGEVKDLAMISFNRLPEEGDSLQIGSYKAVFKKIV